MENTLSSSDQGNAVCVVLLDLSNAFGCVDKKILLYNLEYNGINGKMHKLLKSYLSERKKFVNFGVHESDWEGVEVGVP